MKISIYISLLLVLIISCGKQQNNQVKEVKSISNDSIVQTIHKNWKFTVNPANATVNAKVSSWNDWQNYVIELSIIPNPSLDNMSRKASKLVSNVEVLKNSIPEFYNRPETKARLTLLETNVQNLDMWLGVEPLNTKEILVLLNNIQKNTNSLLYQFEEFEVKAKIPKEVGEDALHQRIDTVKRAKLTAILNTNED